MSPLGRDETCMSLDLAFWHEDCPITSEQAVHVYWQLCDADCSVNKPHEAVAQFVRDLTQRYPPIDDLAEEEVDESPWSCAWEMSPGSVIVCMTWSGGRALAPFFIQMANLHDLVCCDPQRTKVYLPPLLAQS